MTNIRFILKFTCDLVDYIFIIETIMQWISFITFSLIVVWEKQDFITLTIYVVSLIYLFFIDVSRFFYNKFVSSGRVLIVCFGQFIMGIPIVLYTLSYGYDYQIERNWNFLINLSLAFQILKTTLTLRAFKGVRSMVAMVAAAFMDVSLFIVFTLTSAGFLGVMRVITRKIPYDANPNEIYEGTSNEYAYAVSDVYNWGLGNWDDTYEFPWPKALLTLWCSIFLGLAMLNMVIGFFSMTFERFRENHEFYEYEQMNLIVTKVYAFFRATACLKMFRKSSNHKYIHFIYKKAAEQDPNTELDEKIVQVDEKIDALGLKVESIIKILQERVGK